MTRGNQRTYRNPVRYLHIFHTDWLWIRLIILKLLTTHENKIIKDIRRIYF